MGHTPKVTMFFMGNMMNLWTLGADIILINLNLTLHWLLHLRLCWKNICWQNICWNTAISLSILCAVQKVANATNPGAPCMICMVCFPILVVVGVTVERHGIEFSGTRMGHKYENMSMNTKSNKGCWDDWYGCPSCGAKQMVACNDCRVAASRWPAQSLVDNTETATAWEGVPSCPPVDYRQCMKTFPKNTNRLYNSWTDPMIWGVLATSQDSVRSFGCKFWVA